MEKTNLIIISNGSLSFIIIFTNIIIIVEYIYVWLQETLTRQNIWPKWKSSVVYIELD
jgi:hypothetical protein